MSKLSFTFDKPYDEVEVHGDTYRLYYDDDSLRKYQSQAMKYHKEVNKYLKKQSDISNMSDEDVKKIEKEGLETMEGFIEAFYGADSFAKMYEQSGKSMINFVPLVEFTLSWLRGKTPDVDTRKKEYYVKPKKK